MGESDESFDCNSVGLFGCSSLGCGHGTCSRARQHEGPRHEAQHGSGDGYHQPPFEKAFNGPGLQGRWWNNPKVVERLKLTDEQRKAFDDILFQHRETLIDLRANVQKSELALEPLIGSDPPNEAKILAQIDKVAQARAELEKANARYLLALRSKLTPEQWKQVQAFRAEHGMQGNGWRHDGPGHMQGPPPPGPQGDADGEPGQSAPDHAQGLME